MIQAQLKPLTFEEFLEWKPESARYELHNGIVIEMQPAGEHEEIAGFLAVQVTLEFSRLQLPYFIPKQALVKAPDRESGYSPDVLVLNQNALKDEPLWKKFSTVTKGTSVPLAIEVVSSNWRDDYLTKLRDYEEIGISEYWIVDYLGLGGMRYLGSPKEPTIFIYQLVDGEYQVRQFRRNDSIQSSIFPELNLMTDQIFTRKR